MCSRAGSRRRGPLKWGKDVAVLGAGSVGRSSAASIMIRPRGQRRQTPRSRMVHAALQNQDSPKRITVAADIIVTVRNVGNVMCQS